MGASLEKRPERGALFFYGAGSAAGRHAAIDRYSRRVALLKRMLPALGIALVLLVAAWPRLLALFESGAAALPAIDLRQARHLTMIDARFANVDRQNRPYVVTATVARQLPDNKDLLALKAPRAVMALRPGTRVTMTAASGVYQAGAGLLDLFGRVQLVRGEGARFETRRAHLNLGADTARGEDPIEGQGPAGRIIAKGFRVIDKGDTILFTGEARALLKSRKTGTAASAPPSLPATVARKAALLETTALREWAFRKTGKRIEAKARRLREKVSTLRAHSASRHPLPSMPRQKPLAARPGDER